MITSIVSAQDDLSYRNENLDTETRIQNLIEQLTVEEKISLLLYTSPAVDRLGIPEYNWWNESLHGVGRAGLATVFPQAIGLAATFDTSLVFRIATAISDEARAKYNGFQKKGIAQQYAGLTFWSPNLNIFRDPRWGRGQETYGEDPLLSGLLGSSYVRGMQGDHPKFLKTAACAKHFAVHSGPEESRHFYNAMPSTFDLYDTYLPAFKDLADVGVEAFMCAYNQLYEHPCCANEFLLKDVLRDEWGFNGHVVSDCWAISDYVKFQDYSKTEAEAAAKSIVAGVNLNCGSSYHHLGEALEQNLISEEDIDKALKPLLRTRFKLGILGDSGKNPYDKIDKKVVNCKEHVDLAHEAASRSVVLLSNKGNVLPLNRNSLSKLFVTGPLAADIMALLGNYNGLSRNIVTPLEGIVDRCGADVIVGYTLGTQLAKSDKYNGIWQAAGADAVIVFLGNNRLLEGEEGDALLNDHGGDRVSIELPENQIELVRKLRNDAKAKKLIVVISGGSAIACQEITELADAVLFNWYSGEQGGNAIADIIFGNVNPSGKLPVTFYESTSDLPDFDDYSMQNRTYRYFKGKPLFPFGHGLNYSNLKYENLQVDIDRRNEEVKVSGRIENHSDRGGIETIQVYASFENAEGLGLNKKLIGFQPVKIDEESNTTFSIVIPIDKLKVYNTESKRYELIPGNTIIQIGTSSEAIFHKKKKVLAK